VRRRLEEGPLAIYHAGQPEIDRCLEAYEAALREKEEKVEDFKSRNAVLKNSRAGIPVAAAALAGAGNGRRDPLLTGTADDLVREILLYDLSGSADLESSIQGSIKVLEEARDRQPADVREQLGLLVRHARTILKGKAAVDSHLADLQRLPVLRRGEDLYQAYKEYHRSTLERTNAYWLYLYLFAVVLVLYVAWTFLRLRQTALALNQANETLEQRVRERTESLVQANAALEAEVREALAQKDAARLHRAAHNLKGTVASFQAPAAFDAAWRLEVMSRSGRLDGSDEVCRALEGKVWRLERALFEVLTAASG
jgi:HPt (histidine-containing phosphotransfer) domain-containing protein